jgi:hypothetical protein
MKARPIASPDISDLVVSDLFRKRVLDAGMTGMQFVPTEDFKLS